MSIEDGPPSNSFEQAMLDPKLVNLVTPIPNAQIDFAAIIEKALTPISAAVEKINKRLEDIENENNYGQPPPDWDEGANYSPCPTPSERMFNIDDYDRDDGIEKEAYIDPNYALSSHHHIENLYRGLYCLPAEGKLNERQCAILDLFGDDVYSFCHSCHIDPNLPFDEEIKADFTEYYFALSDKKARSIDMARAGTTYVGTQSCDGPRPSPVPLHPETEPTQFGTRILDAINATNTTAHNNIKVSSDKRAHTTTHNLENTGPEDTTQFHMTREQDGGTTWFVVGKSGKVSFADAVRNPAATRATTPATITVSQAKGQLTREQLNAMTKAQVAAAYGIRFGNPSRARAATKEAIVEAYMAKASSPPTASPLTRPATDKPKILQSTDFTVICGPEARTLARQKPEATHIARNIQKAIQQGFAPNRPPIQLLAGRWSSQASPNFVLTFAGQPSLDEVFKVRNVLLQPFGKGCTIAPQVGYTRALLNLVPVLRTPSGDIPDNAALLAELSINPVFDGLPIVSPPRWLKANIDRDKIHSSVTFAFIDPDGTRMQVLIRQPLSMFGAVVVAKRFKSQPMIRQCDRCYRLGHTSQRCPRPKTTVVCPICAGTHEVKEHVLKCPGKQTHNTAFECNCTPQCFNCHAAKKPHTGHISTDTTCPLRELYRSGTRRNNNNSNDEEWTPESAGKNDISAVMSHRSTHTSPSL